MPKANTDNDARVRSPLLSLGCLIEWCSINVEGVAAVLQLLQFEVSLLSPRDVLNATVVVCSLTSAIQIVMVALSLPIVALS